MGSSCLVQVSLQTTHNGVPGGTQTPNLQIRNLALCPIELRKHELLYSTFTKRFS